jgi:c-di-GMP-binding flagellar brake protein YcgR
MIWDGTEHRRHKRVGVKGCTVQYKLTRWFGLFSSFSNRYLVLNISQGGLSFISKEEINPGTKIYLLINAPLLNNHGITITGVVVWSKKSAQMDAYRLGIKFTRLSKRASQRLRIILDNALLDHIDISTKVYLKEVDKL